LRNQKESQNSLNSKSDRLLGLSLEKDRKIKGENEKKILACEAALTAGINKGPSNTDAVEDDSFDSAFLFSSPFWEFL
jgi:hypothetical protein